MHRGSRAAVEPKARWHGPATASRAQSPACRVDGLLSAETLRGSTASCRASRARPRIDARGAVYFRATLRSGGTGFFAGDGGPTNTLYVTGGEFAVFPSSFAHQVHGQFGSFRATLTGGLDGVFKGNGLVTETLVTAGGPYRDFFGAEINDPGTVAISADLTAGGQLQI